MLAISQKKSGPERQLNYARRTAIKGSVRSSRYAERAAPLWTARRNQIAARHRSASRSRSAALDVVRRRFTASTPDTVLTIKTFERLAAPICSENCRAEVRAENADRNFRRLRNIGSLFSQLRSRQDYASQILGDENWAAKVSGAVPRYRAAKPFESWRRERPWSARRAASRLVPPKRP